LFKMYDKELLVQWLTWKLEHDPWAAEFKPELRALWPILDAGLDRLTVDLALNWVEARRPEWLPALKTPEGREWLKAVLEEMVIVLRRAWEACR